MPFCPVCKYEYNVECSTCPDCEERLVAELPPESETSQEVPEDKYKDWVPMARFNSDMTAEMVLETLRMNDVPAIIVSGAGHFGQTGQMGISLLQPVGGNYTLMIPHDRVAETDEICQAILGEEWQKMKIVDIERG